MNRHASSSDYAALSRFHRSLWLTLGISLLFMGLFVYYVQAEKAIDQANELRLRSLWAGGRAASILRRPDPHGAHLLATGEPAYQRHYLEILAIRDGRARGRWTTRTSTGTWCRATAAPPWRWARPCPC
jgi:hypothetical protein